MSYRFTTSTPAPAVTVSLRENSNGTVDLMAKGYTIGTFGTDGKLALASGVPSSAAAVDNRGRMLIVDAGHGGPIEQKAR